MKKYLIISVLCLAGISLMAQSRSVTWEKFNVSGPALKPMGQIAVRPSKDIAASQWSVGCETLDRDYGKFINYKSYVGELGVKSARIQSGWAKCEQTKGEYYFEWLDTCVYGLSEQMVKPWICLCYGNPLYGANKELGAKIFTDEATMSAWLQYVEATVKRYKNTVTEWEIWNEPNLRSNPPEAYASLLMKTTESIKKVQPEAVIIGFSLAGISTDWAKGVFEVLKANNKTNIVDFLTYHPYVHNPDDALSNIRELSEMAKSYDPGIRLFQGETGCPSILEWGHALSYYEWTEYSQVKWDLRQMINHWAEGIRYSVFTLVDLQYPNMLQSFGLLRTNLLKQVVYKRPSYYAVQHVVNLLDNSVTPSGKHKYTANTMRKISVVGIKKDNVFGVMLWYNDRIPDNGLKWDLTDITIENVTLKDPVFVELVTGKVYEIPTYNRRTIGMDMKFIDLPLRDSPVLIAERSQLTIKESE